MRASRLAAASGSASALFPILLLTHLLPCHLARQPDASWYGTAAHPNAAFRSVLDFGAVGDGVHDDTAAIQAALNHERGVAGAKAPAVVYLPPGEYLVSDTLQLWGFTELRGCSTQPPTLRLAPHAPGFDNTSALKPMVATNSAFGVNLTAGMPAWWDNALPTNFMFYMHIHSVDLDVSAAGNAGAVALYCCPAQQSSARALRITVGGAHAGVDVCQVAGYAPAGGGGPGGGGSVEDVAVSGGAYSLRGTASQFAFRGLRLSGARVAAIALQDFVWVFAFVDVVVADAPAALVTSALADRHSTAVLLIDAVLRNISGPAALLLGGAGTPTFLQNVSLRGPALPGALVANASGAVWLSATPASVTRWVGWVGDTSAVGNFVRGVRTGGSMAALPGAPAAPLTSRPRPFFDDLPALPCNAVTDCGASGDGARDDTAALQTCLNRCAAVFLPFGHYRVCDTLNLTARTSLIGELLANVVLAPQSPGFGDAAAPRPVLDTPDDAAAQVRISGVSLAAGAGNAGAVMLRWRAGPASGLWDVNVNISAPVQVGILAQGAGGGAWSNLHVWGADHAWQDNTPLTNVDDRAAVGVRIESAGPLAAYALISEHATERMVHVHGARSVDLVVTQTEQYQYAMARANETVHVLIDGGAQNIAVYGALTCNWWNPQVLRLVAVQGVGSNVSLFGAKGVGSGSCLVHQPSTPGICLNGTRADPPFYGVPADVCVPSA